METLMNIVIREKDSDEAEESEEKQKKKGVEIKAMMKSVMVELTYHCLQ